MKKSSLLILLTLLFAHTASADPYTLVFTSTVETPQSGGSLPPRVNVFGNKQQPWRTLNQC